MNAGRIISLALCFSLSGLANITNITSGGFAYTTLGAAIDMANYGDTLLITVGTYDEHMHIYQKSLKFLGGYAADFHSRTNDARLTVVNAGAAASVLSVVSHCDVVVDCMTLTNGAAAAGGGIFLERWVTVLAQTSVIACSSAIRGGGIAVGSNSTLTLIDTPVFGSSAEQGGGIYATGDNTAVVLKGARTEIYGNSATDGGGIWADDATVSILSNASVFGNVATARGGGLYLGNGAHATVNGAGSGVGTAAPNQATNAVAEGGGAYVRESSLVVEDGAGFWANSATVRGGAVLVTNGSVVVRNDAAIGHAGGTLSNSAFGGGGGICAIDALVVVSNNARIVHGAAGVGGGVLLWNATGIFDHAVVAGNSAYHDGGGLFAYLTSVVAMTACRFENNHADEYGGAIYLQRLPRTACISATDMTNNTAGIAAGAVYANDCGDVVLQGGGGMAHNRAVVAGAAFFEGCQLVVMDAVRVASNTASDCGGVVLSSCPDFDLADCDFLDNVALSNAGAVQIERSAGRLRTVARASHIGGNRTSGGGGIRLVDHSLLAIAAPVHALQIISNAVTSYGGGLWCTDSSTVTVMGAVAFMGNSAKNGGALHADNESVVALLPTNGAAPQFLGNAAEDSGGAVNLMLDARLLAMNCRFSGNSAVACGGALHADWCQVRVQGDFSVPVSGPPCVFFDNTAHVGGACYIEDESTFHLQDALIVSNRVTHIGGGVRVETGSHASMINCVVARNTAPTAGGISVGLSVRAALWYCTVADNDADGVYCYGGVIGLTNCVVWGNTSTQINAGFTVDSSDVQGGYVGVDNLDVDPLFKAPAALNWALALGSPCVDTAINCGVTLDCRGAPRPMGYGFDMGAYELDPAPVLAVTPTQLDFGVLTLNTSSNLTALVESSGNGWLTGAIYNVPVPIFTAAPVSYIIPPNSATDVIFTFTPPISYAWTQTITFASNGGSLDLQLIGRGIPEPLMLCWLAAAVCAWRRCAAQQRHGCAPHGSVVKVPYAGHGMR